MDKFTFPVDFLILDVDDKVEVLHILERPFFATSKALIDVKDAQMVVRVGEEEIILKLRDTMRHSMNFDDTCYYVDVVDDFVFECMQDKFMKDEFFELLEN